jgi:hypothetical protein
LYDRKQSGPFGSERFLGRAIMAPGGLAATRFTRPLTSKRQHPSDNPLLVWITLWATWRRDAPSHENAGPATDCSKLKQKEVVENQALARM